MSESKPDDLKKEEKDKRKRCLYTFPLYVYVYVFLLHIQFSFKCLPVKANKCVSVSWCRAMDWHPIQMHSCPMLCVPGIGSGFTIALSRPQGLLEVFSNSYRWVCLKFQELEVQ